MCAQAVVSDDVEVVLDAGLAVVPPESRLAAAVRHGAIAAVSSAPRPETCTVFVSNTPPEVVSTDSVRVGSTINSGYTLFFTCEVPFFL